MTRIGQNPAKLGMQAYQPKKLGMATITYIPSQEGYFRDSLAILKLTLESLHRNTSEPFDLLVFDNGSSATIQKELIELQHQGVIDWLILAGKNLGKTGAQNWIFSVMPNEWIGYTDSDVLFRKGWLEASREIIAHFPDAGMVGAQPCYFDVLKGKGQAHLLLTLESRLSDHDLFSGRRCNQRILSRCECHTGAVSQISCGSTRACSGEKGWFPGQSGCFPYAVHDSGRACEAHHPVALSFGVKPGGGSPA